MRVALGRIGRGLPVAWLIDLFIAALVSVALLAFTLKLWRYDFSVPFNYRGDTLHFAALVKGLLLNGWPHHIPQLSAPLGFDAVAFPSLSTTDWLLMHLIAVFVKSPGTILNMFWLVSIVLTALSCTMALRLLGTSRPIAVAAGALFALLPYAFMRNTGHISLVYYTVPLLSALCIYLLRGEPSSPNARPLYWWGLAAAVAQGFNYVYFSFFAVVLIALSGLIGFGLGGKFKTVYQTLAVCAVLGIASILNLAPSINNWSNEGKPAEMDYKRPAEVEVYALKLRKLLLPHEENRMPVLRTWAKLDRDANFSNENENEAARLGLFGSVGLVLALGLLVHAALARTQSGSDNGALAAAVLLLFTLLTATVGGFGAIFSVLVVPDIRAYNRFSVFLAFFAFAVLALALTTALQRARNRWIARALAAATVSLIAFSAYDQLLEARPLTDRYASDARAAEAEHEAVRTLESAFAGSANVFQLPITGFPPDGGMVRMGAYDHARPFLWSTRLNWSWPTFSNRSRAWIAGVLRKPPDQLAEELVLASFDAVWVDRFGYPDQGAEIIGWLRMAGAATIEASGESRFALFDLRPVGNAMKARLGTEGFKASAERALPGVSVEYGSGFYPSERTSDGREFRWMQSTAQMRLRNHTSVAHEVQIEATLQTGAATTVNLRVGDSLVIPLAASPTGTRFQVTVSVPADEFLKLSWLSSHDPVKAPGDRRSLYAALIDLRVSSSP